ncbi:hypothetical protein PIROE2DRAFT_1573 [Piromyces sp. E2]|nr:hypothetical protein PIROE2DRAFT_1573 [Piromyces sp. E2]|eukprot:OUM70407.1 hypothetical protein PIROE2DRAFT_1573 [Piromyces sp. E2]
MDFNSDNQEENIPNKNDEYLHDIKAKLISAITNFIPTFLKVDYVIVLKENSKEVSNCTPSGKSIITYAIFLNLKRKTLNFISKIFANANKIQTSGFNFPINIQLPNGKSMNIR